jgi:hypothetical protein
MKITKFEAGFFTGLATSFVALALIVYMVVNFY